MHYCRTHLQHASASNHNWMFLEAFTVGLHRQRHTRISLSRSLSLSLTPLPLTVPGVPQLWWTLDCPARLVDSLRKALHWSNVSLSCSQCQPKVSMLTLFLWCCSFVMNISVIIILALLTPLLVLFLKMANQLLTFTLRVSFQLFSHSLSPVASLKTFAKAFINS